VIWPGPPQTKRWYGRRLTSLMAQPRMEPEAKRIVKVSRERV
jgi:hypothetical protein